MRITALRTGWVRVKRPHQDYGGIDALRFPAIILARQWGPWMPIISYVVEHPERTVMVDTGAAVDINDPEYLACDPSNDWFYRRNLRFFTNPAEGLAARLAQAGIDGQAVDDVIVTTFMRITSVALEPFRRGCLRGCRTSPRMVAAARAQGAAGRRRRGVAGP